MRVAAPASLHRGGSPVAMLNQLPARVARAGGRWALATPPSAAGAPLRTSLLLLRTPAPSATAPRAAASDASTSFGGTDSAASSSNYTSSSSSSSTAATGAGPRVCILGGGFGGLYTAVKLESLIWPKGKKPQVTLVDQGERFVFKPLLYELINGTAAPAEVAPTFAQLLAPYPVRFVRARVQGVELAEAPSSGGGGGAAAAAAAAAQAAESAAGAGAGASPSAAAGAVVLEGGARIEYDYLVVALGAEPDPRGVPGVLEHARPFVTLEDAEYVTERLAALEAAAAAAGGSGGSGAPPTVVVVGAGYAGVELCSVIGERLRGRGVALKLVTPTDDILPGAPAGQRDAARKALDDMGVALLPRVKVERLSAPPADGGGAAEAASAPPPGRCVVELSSVDGGGGSSTQQQQQQKLDADLVVWTAGLAPASKFVRALPFPSTPAGAIEAEPTLRVRGHPSAFALGDVAFAPEPAAGAQESAAAAAAAAAAAYPATAQVAFQQADYAAWNIWSAINGRPLLPFRYQHLGSMMSLGAANAAVALPVELPAPLAAALAGSPLEGLLSAAGVRAGAPGGVTLQGPLAQLLRRAAYLYRQPTGEQRLSVAAGWVAQAADAAAKLAKELGATSGADAANKTFR